jgi:predicted nuclease of predicted toxin-antitoxin system
MIIGIDAQLPPTLAGWIVETFGVTAISLKELGLRDGKLLPIRGEGSFILWGKR